MPAQRDLVSATSHESRYVFRIATIFVGLCAGLALAETGVRYSGWKPAKQIVRGYGLHSVNGVPVWEYSDDRQNRTCAEQHPERTRVLFFGSSITFGTGLSAQEAFTTALEARLNEMRPAPGFCILNFAQAGFSFEQKYAVARAEVARYRPALLMWEDWVEWTDYTMIGDGAYGTSGLKIRPDGFIGVAGIPDGLNRALFLHSRLYQYLALAFGESIRRLPDQEEATTFVNQRLIKVPRLAQSVGAKVVMYLAPPLDRPFAETAAAPPGWHSILLKFAEAQGIPVYPLQHELIDQDYLKLRMDPCCHYNAEGHRALVPVMERIILRQLDAQLPSSG